MRALHDAVGARADVDVQRVEEVFVGEFEVVFFQGQRELGGELMHAHADVAQAFRTVPDGEATGHDGEQRLRGADVAGRLFAADVLFARLQGEAVGGFAVAIDGYADKAAGHGALEAVARCHECGVRPAEAERHAEALRIADDDVGVPFARRGEHGQGEQVGGDHQHRAVGMGDFGETAVIGDVAVGVRVLHQDAEVFGLRQIVFAIDDRDFDVLITGAG